MKIGNFFFLIPIALGAAITANFAFPSLPPGVAKVAYNEWDSRAIFFAKDPNPSQGFKPFQIGVMTKRPTHMGFHDDSIEKAIDQCIAAYDSRSYKGNHDIREVFDLPKLRNNPEFVSLIHHFTLRFSKNNGVLALVFLTKGQFEASIKVADESGPEKNQTLFSAKGTSPLDALENLENVRSLTTSAYRPHLNGS